MKIYKNLPGFFSVIKFINHLKITTLKEVVRLNLLIKLKVGLLINFGSAGKLEWKRFIRSKNT